MLFCGNYRNDHFINSFYTMFVQSARDTRKCHATGLHFFHVPSDIAHACQHILCIRCVVGIGAKLDAVDMRKFAIRLLAPLRQWQTIVINQFHIGDNCNYFDILFISQCKFIISIWVEVRANEWGISPHNLFPRFDASNLHLSLARYQNTNIKKLFRTATLQRK